MHTRRHLVYSRSLSTRSSSPPSLSPVHHTRTSETKWARARAPHAQEAEAAERRAQLLREHAANEEKDKGNAQFKQGKYAAAIACYTRGMAHDPQSAALVANRAMAHLKMKNYVNAELDCTAAIELAPTYVTAFPPRATRALTDHTPTATLACWPNDQSLVVLLKSHGRVWPPVGNACHMDTALRGHVLTAPYGNAVATHGK